MTPCVNPFIYLVEYAEWYISQNPGTTFADVLDLPNLFPKSANICCYSCKPNKPYILGGNLTNIASFLEQYTNFIDDKCCTNIYSTVNSYTIIKELHALYNQDPVKSCCTNDDFTKCIDDLATYFNSEEFNSYLFDLDSVKGIYENTINGNTLMCEIKEFLETLPINDALYYILTILDKGLVVQCVEGGVYISSIDTYISSI